MKLLNARLLGRPGLFQVQIDAQQKIESIQPMDQRLASLTELSAPTIDLAGDWLSLGGIDLQINGALGLAFPELQPGQEEQVWQICQFLWQQGVDGFLPTLVTTSLDNFHRAMAVIDQVMTYQQRDQGAGVAKILGVHLEGPFLNRAKRGAHPEAHLRPLELAEVKQLLGKHGEIVRLMTLAPELDPSGQVIAALTQQGIAVSLGHSQATAAEAGVAFRQGATMITHAFNAMPVLHHREPGLLGAALTQAPVMAGFIADGQHICLTMLDLLLRISRGNRARAGNLFLVSDALAPLGLPDGEYPWDDRTITIHQGTARLPDGTLAGTTLPLLTGAANLVKWGLAEVEEAIELATEAPRRAIGLPGLQLGQPAHLLRWQVDQGEGDRRLTWQRIAV